MIFSLSIQNQTNVDLIITQGAYKRSELSFLFFFPFLLCVVGLGERRIPALQEVGGSFWRSFNSFRMRFDAMAEDPERNPRSIRNWGEEKKWKKNRENRDEERREGGRDFNLIGEKKNEVIPAGVFLDPPLLTRSQGRENGERGKQGKTTSFINGWRGSLSLLVHLLNFFHFLGFLNICKIRFCLVIIALINIDILT